MPVSRIPAILILYVLLAATPARAADFVISDIRVEGLQRIAPGTVFNYLPLKVGDVLDRAASQRALRALFKTEFFNDIRFEREGDVLVVVVDERPSVSEITITGNKSIESADLLTGLKQTGLATGNVFNRSLLDRIQQELRQVYFSRGRYGVSIDATAKPLSRNRVEVVIAIDEGEVATIEGISFVGNQVFKDKELRKQLGLSTGGWLSFISKDNQYSKQKLSAGLEALRSFYLDQGYLNFRIDSAQVTITPDRRGIYVTVNMTEGEVYRLGEVKLAGNLILPEEELVKLVFSSTGDVFSRARTTATTTAITEKLGDQGYAFANVNAIPVVDEAAKTVALTYYVDPGKRVYVRQVSVAGNTKTRDEVVRREVRQMEGAPISTKLVKLSRSRLRRLNYFDDVTIETPPVPGSPDEVDLNVGVKEKPSGVLLAGIGFSQSQGIVLNGSITQDNFLGSGKRVTLAASNSTAVRNYRFGYTNPYYTIDGISRGFDLRYQSTNADDIDIADYTTDVSYAGVNFGLPLNEFDSVRFTLGFEHSAISAGSGASQEITDYIDENGDSFAGFKATASWRHDTRDSAVFPTQGVEQQLDVEVGLPGSDIEFYKVRYRHNWFRPLIGDYVLVLGGDLGYADVYGQAEELPFFENFFAGGIRSVRGFEDNTLGPRDSQDDPLGGASMIVGRAEVQFPVPFRLDTKSARLGVFLDAGGVFSQDASFDTGELRYSTGVSALWLSPLGALAFSLALPLNADADDDAQPFQFTFGNTF